MTSHQKGLTGKEERYYVDKSNLGFSVWDALQNESLEYFGNDQVKAEKYCKKLNKKWSKMPYPTSTKWRCIQCKSENNGTSNVCYDCGSIYNE